ncbi:hypothetical protein J3R30DRAFT_1823005 [Lentinula aciculospora]|uniref:Uncharacterized protein n=1 Tax=Lentinula aciculospora TaxID=153920 RepID=A0A9W9AIR1_9AGAR|nr:hypothetical protein J3R30DRAFT_1823005 [Lentinula aciculospora]
MSSPQSLPCYTASSPPPFYSARVNEGEEVLAATRVYQIPTGSFTARCHCGDLTVTVKEQNEDIETPVYHQRGLILGTFSHKNPENFLQVLLKIEGKLRISILGQNAASSSIKIVDESYELWSRRHAGMACPRVIDFASVLPSTYKEGNSEFPLPPSHKISLTGLPGLQSECSYTIKVILLVRGPLWNKTKSFSIPFKHLPRGRPSMPLISNPRVQTGYALFLETVKCAPEVWFEKKSILQTRPSLRLAPIEVQFFIPSERTFGLADEIPFHIQLTGPVLSLLELYTHLLTEQVDDMTSVAPLSSPPSPVSPGQTRVHKSNSKHFISLTVTLNRQVCVDIKDQTVWKNFVIGEGRVHLLPPPFESVRKAEAACSSCNYNANSGHDLDSVGFLDGAGDIKCSPEVEHGHFDVGRVQVKDFIVLQIAPVHSSDNSRSPFFPLKIAVPIFLVSESWSETMIA